MHQTPTTSNERSVLALLRGLVPRRSLYYHEALRIAELQANHLLEHFDVQTSAVPDEIITELPRIRVEHERHLPVSGAAHWNGRYWVITVNANESPLRQRFSLAHEFKHVIDHTTRDYIYADRPTLSAHEQAERVADYFAACLLMPKRVVKRLWFGGHQNTAALARMLRVSEPALRYRLDQLGITEGPRRCVQPRARHFAVRRSLSIAEVRQ